MELDPDTRQRLAFLNLGDEDRVLLAELEPVLEKHADGLVAAFYRHLLSFAPTRQLLRDPAVKDRLLGKQREYLLSLARPSFDARVRRRAPADRRGAPAASASSRAGTSAPMRSTSRC